MLHNAKYTMLVFFIESKALILHLYLQNTEREQHVSLTKKLNYITFHIIDLRERFSEWSGSFLPFSTQNLSVLLTFSNVSLSISISISLSVSLLGSASRRGGECYWRWSQSEKK